MKIVRYMCAQPAIDYYTWQVEVMLLNFIKHGINPNHIDIVCGIKNGQIPDNWIKLANCYKFVRFFFYEDDRISPAYISSIRPNLLKKHFATFPELKDDIIFYHDSDMIFTRPVAPIISQFMNDDIWYCSDTRFYIGADYIKSKNHGIYEEMCKIIGIAENIPEDNEQNSGGAQYIMKNIDAEYWEKVERDSETLYKFFLEHLKEHPETSEYHPIQKWTADMWAVLWNAWYFGHSVKTPKELDFTWGTQSTSDWDKNLIFHNAGVLASEREKLFYKGDYIHKLPYQLDNFVADNMASHKYLQEIIETSERSCLINAQPMGMPSIPQMASNLGGDIAKNIKHALSGESLLVDENVAAERFNICKSCDFFIENRCSKCGCFMEAKSKFTVSSCPVGKW